MKTRKSYRFGTATIQDLEYIKKEMKINETEAIDWALRLAVRRMQKIKDECLLDKSSD